MTKNSEPRRWIWEEWKTTSFIYFIKDGYSIGDKNKEQLTLEANDEYITHLEENKQFLLEKNKLLEKENRKLLECRLVVERYFPFNDFIQKGGYGSVGEFHGDIAIKTIQELEKINENLTDAYYDRNQKIVYKAKQITKLREALELIAENKYCHDETIYCVVAETALKECFGDE